MNEMSTGIRPWPSLYSEPCTLSINKKINRLLANGTVTQHVCVYVWFEFAPILAVSTPGTFSGLVCGPVGCMQSVADSLHLIYLQSLELTITQAHTRTLTYTHTSTVVASWWDFWRWLSVRGLSDHSTLHPEQHNPVSLVWALMWPGWTTTAQCVVCFDPSALCCLLGVLGREVEGGKCCGWSDAPTAGRVKKEKSWFTRENEWNQNGLPTPTVRERVKKERKKERNQRPRETHLLIFVLETWCLVPNN